jgi:UTP--glucose-1-phosphate uridylyltransferase
MSGMVELYGKVGGNIVAVGECDPDLAHKYGIVGKGEELDGGFRITQMVEKPGQGHRSVELFHQWPLYSSAGDFEILALQERGAGNEIQVTDAMLKLAEIQPFSAYRFGGDTYDCGSKDGFIMANVAYALARPDIKPLVAEGLKRLITSGPAGMATRTGTQIAVLRRLGISAAAGVRRRPARFPHRCGQVLRLSRSSHPHPDRGSG